MVTGHTRPGDVTRSQDRPYSSWFVLGKALLWVYNAGFALLLWMIGFVVVVMAWTGRPLDGPNFRSSRVQRVYWDDLRRPAGC